MAAGLALVVLSAACDTSGEPVDQTPDTDEPAADPEQPDPADDVATSSEDDGPATEGLDAPEPLDEIEIDDIEVAAERSAAVARRDTEEALDAVDDLTSDVMYLSEYAEPCFRADGNRHGQTVLLRVEPEDQDEVLTRLAERWVEAGFDLHEDDDGIAVIHDDGSQRWASRQEADTMTYISMGSCESTAEGAPSLLDVAASALELPAAFVFDALAGDAAAMTDNSTMRCDGDRVASFSTLAAVLDAPLEPELVRAELAAAFPGAQRLDHGPRATDVVTEEGTVTVRTRADRLTVASRTRCSERETGSP